MVQETRSPGQTFEIGVRLGRKAKPGQVYTLTGDLGVGKTVFTQGFAKGLGIEEPVFRGSRPDHGQRTELLKRGGSDRICRKPCESGTSGSEEGGL